MLSLATACILFALPCSSCWKFLSPMLSPKIGLKLRICISCFELQLSLWLNICGINEAISEGSGQIIFSYFCLWVSFDSRRHNYCTFYISSKSHRFEEGWPVESIHISNKLIHLFSTRKPSCLKIIWLWF